VDVAVGVGVVVRVAVDVDVVVRVAVDVDVGVAVPVGASWASLTLRGSVLKLAKINTPRTPMTASRLNTGLQSAIAGAACLGANLTTGPDDCHRSQTLD